MDLDTQAMLRGSLRPLLMSKDEQPLHERLAALGWEEALADDASTSVRILFETKGEVLSSADALGPLLASTIATRTAVDELTSATVVLPVSIQAGQGRSRVDGSWLVVEGVSLSAPADTTYLVPVEVDGAIRVAVGVGEVVAVPIGGMDADLGLVRISGSLKAGAVTWLDDKLAAPAWEAAIAIGRWALSAELVAIGSRVVADAVDYTTERHQYGRPIGSFQALQHRLAAAHATVVGAAQVTVEASLSGLPWDALVAKYLAGRAAEHACTQAQQSYGAIGFTWEHHFHRSLRRTYALDQLLGAWRELEVEIGETLRRTGVVPKIGGL